MSIEYNDLISLCSDSAFWPHPLCTMCQWKSVNSYGQRFCLFEFNDKRHTQYGVTVQRSVAYLNVRTSGVAWQIIEIFARIKFDLIQK
uniref:CUB domain-containing protein n=1 Tax=Loa loa TaxID=7209 RepID=A0A1I7VKV4_LOALO